MSATGMKKAVVIGDVFSRFMMAIAVPAETATAIAEVLVERWIAVFGPPVRLLSDGEIFMCRTLCRTFARGWVLRNSSPVRTLRRLTAW
jgi:hypothetical protein